MYAIHSLRSRTARSGVVLIVAVFALALMLILLLALFQGTAFQMHSAESEATRAREKILADSAVALVIGQIQQASSKPGEAWISQPGLLRTYNAINKRVPTASYKLYSSTPMIDTSGTLSFLASDVPANWSSQPAQYTDLNSPVQTAGILGQTIYPILDPSVAKTAEGVSMETGHNAEMPVAWLYQLQDGTLGPASNGTATNPIVARIAFWTDDDSCKININTAGCGSPWNSPRVNSPDDVAWSTEQPAAGEYSAYPGHPATTSLAAALGTNSFSPQEFLDLTPRYAWGGSEFGALTTTPGQSVTPKMDRLYASLDELCFGPNLNNSGQRQASRINAAQIESNRFLLTAHSQAPETTLPGEPRIAIWPVADSTSATAPKITATDRAIMSAATIGAGTKNPRNYFFQRNDPLNPLDDFDRTPPESPATQSNLQLFDELVARGNVPLPGYGTTLNANYPEPRWSQLMLEITDFIRSLNAVDPSPAPFVPFAPGDPKTDLGRGFIVPLTSTYIDGANKIPLRGLGRCPTLSSLTLVFYVCGFGFDKASKQPPVDFEVTPDDDKGTYWKANFAPDSPLWTHVTSELVRAFIVPCTFQPGSAYPEVSDDCTIQINGLDSISLTNATTKDFNFGFSKQTPASRRLGEALQVLPQERAWGNNEGPLAWQAAALDAQNKDKTFSYPFAGANALSVPFASKFQYDPKTGLKWPPTKSRLIFSKAPQITVLIRDSKGTPLQTFSINLPESLPKGIGVPVPTLTGEYSQDASANPVQPSYYMCLKNRVLTTPANRLFMIQPGDTSRSMEAASDLRVMAALANVPDSFFQPHPIYKSQATAHAHNLYFADGTAVYGASGNTNLHSDVNYATDTKPLNWTNWLDNSSTNYAWPTSPRRSCLTGSATGVTMNPIHNLRGDWDTGLGLAPDGALINLPDSGTSLDPRTAYFSLSGGQMGAATQRTPNALIPSPVVFGSLPAGIDPANPARSEPWRTLLFCPYPLAGPAHPGFGDWSATPPLAPDHLILDNFWMPVVEPYGISSCMATAGKINLNDQIAPFTYLHRSTALRALLDDLRIPAIPITSGLNYKSPGKPISSIWNPVDADATISQIENRFAHSSADAYLSESEICTVPLVPQGQAASTVTATRNALTTFWDTASGLTGDNLRELPYAQLYSRLTTRSNSYTVHVHVQVLKKLTHDPNQNVWNEGVDLIKGDWRGSYEIERYLDPDASAPKAGTPLGPYKFRIVSSRQFAP